MLTGDPALTLLLETVQDEHRFRKLDRVDRSIRAASIVFDDFQHASAAEALERRGRVVLVAHLRQRQRATETPPHIRRQRHQVFVAARDPLERLFLAGNESVYTCSGKAQARRIAHNAA
jgi:hypothetical protein